MLFDNISDNFGIKSMFLNMSGSAIQDACVIGFDLIKIGGYTIFQDVR